MRTKAHQYSSSIDEEESSAKVVLMRKKAHDWFCGSG
jgi:hypothetical protein